jgi:hypothetical protein
MRPRPLLRGYVALKVDTDADALAILHGLPPPDALIILSQLAHVGKAVRLDTRLGLSFGEAVGTGNWSAGVGRSLGVFTAGVLASRFPGCATANVGIIAAAAAIARYVRMFL